MSEDRAREWESCWLYDEKEADGNKLSEALRCEGFDGEHPIIKNAARELVSSGALDGALLCRKDEGLPAESFSYSEENRTISASDESGVLYGVFHLIRESRLNGGEVCSFGPCVPSDPIRMLDHWDNMDGSIERGYAGKSFFFKDGEFISSPRLRDYCRLISSVGINAVAINNVNVKDSATYLITKRYFSELKKLSDLFFSYGIKLFLSLNFAASMELGGLDTADPLDGGVREWWRDKLDEVFEEVPHLGGFLVKADSEGRPGPFTYGRTQADGANMLAEAARPHGGIIIWRCFVYNCTQDWRDKKTDRARAGYDNFINTDGDYADNVILQIKNGPMDFQIREPVSPLFGGLKSTNMMLEVQLAQEYTGQQIDICYLVPMFKEVLDFNTDGPSGEGDTVAKTVSGRATGHRVAKGMSGVAAVANTGDDANWTGGDLAQANLYGFGRLTFDNSLSAERIAEEWVGLTYGERATDALVPILLSSRETYEKYTSPLGIGWMVTPSTHYGPSVDGYEYDRWGTYHRADHTGIGVDRTERGTGYAAQYGREWQAVYEDPEKCPEELLLFFHRVEYTHRLRSGKSLIQHIYDTHFDGVRAVEAYMDELAGLKGLIPEAAYLRIIERVKRQLDNAREWRDQVNSYFYRKSGIPDELGRRIY